HEAALAGDHRVEERRSEDGVSGRPCAAGKGGRSGSARALNENHGVFVAVVRHLDTLATRAGGPRAARSQARRSLPPDDHALEPMEGPQEESRLAAVSRILLRALRP